ncbi:MAG: YqgE/AlgH family protein [Pseudomonadota bacterium]
METDAPPFLDGRILIAMPGMGDPRFARSVVFMCAHSSDGAMGLIINKPARQMRFPDLLGQLEIEATEETPDLSVHFGGPVEHGRGFVLHSSDYSVEEGTLAIDERFGMTATMEILRDIAAGRGPGDALLMLGYSGWGPGQLEGEIQQNGWLIGEADRELLFEVPDAGKWDRAVTAMGVDPAMLSAEGGRA